MVERIHAVHGHGGKSIWSGALRLGLPLSGGLTLAAASSPPPRSGADDANLGRGIAIVGGVLLGAIVIAIVDEQLHP